ncbi:MAG: hypothetical protein KAR83_06300 [Thermodesulfovibrionales bacterium]|nr:hypothetical protein [Thermodesulfovibrionales bacterium]
MRLRAGYIAASVIIAGVVLASYVFYAMGAGNTAYSYGARERAELLADVILNSFLSQSHSGGKADVERFLGYLTDSRAGGIKSVRLLDPEGGEPYARAMLEKKSAYTEEGLSAEGRAIIEVTRAVINLDNCRGCHSKDGDVLAFLNIEVEADGPGYRARQLSQDLMGRGIFFSLVLVASLGLAAMLFRAQSTPEPQGEGAAERDRLHGGFGSLFAWLNAAGKTPDSRSIRSMEKVEKMATIGELSAAIAHEIKNPLAGISGAIQVLAEGFPRDDQRREIMDEVLAEISRLDKTVRNLMAFARPPAPSLIRMPVSAIIERTVELIAGQAKKQHIDVNILSTDDLAVVRADPDQMQQVLLNIIVNALHAMPQGGELKVATRVIKAEGVVEVAVSDNGRGIAEADVERIFEPFFTTKTSGTGLGLAICRNIVESHRGTVDVKSAPGQGATFRIRLPLEN